MSSPETRAPRRFVAVDRQALKDAALVIAVARTFATALATALLWTVAGWHPWTMAIAIALTLALVVELPLCATIMTRHSAMAPVGLLTACLTAIFLSPTAAVLIVIAESGPETRLEDTPAPADEKGDEDPCRWQCRSKAAV